MAACRERPVAAWGIPAIPVEAKLGLIPLMPPAPANAARFWKKIKTNPVNNCRQPRFDEKKPGATEFWRKRKPKYLAPANAARFWKIKTNPLITVDNLDLTRKKNRTEPNFGGNGSLSMKNQNKSFNNCRQPQFDEKKTDGTEFWRKRKPKYLYFPRQIVVIPWRNLRIGERKKIEITVLGGNGSAWKIILFKWKPWPQNCVSTPKQCYHIMKSEKID